jgi:steroid delta-isomerase-like uncharacterized protein
MTLLERWYEEVWNKGRESAIDEMAVAGLVAHGLTPDGTPVQGIEPFKTFFRVFQSTLSEIRVKVEHTVSEGDLSVVHCTVRAKHTGDAIGVPPKGNAIHFTGMSMVRIRDGRITEAWNYFDFPKMYQQML